MSTPLYSRDTPVAEFRDPTTGRRIRQLTDSTEGRRGMGYFRVPKRTPDGWLMARVNLAIHPDSGQVRELPLDHFNLLHLDETSGRGWLYEPARRALWSIDFPFGEPRRTAELPGDWPARLHPVAQTADGGQVILIENESEDIAIPRGRDAVALWRYFNRRRQGTLWAWSPLTRERVQLAHFDHLALGHVLPSPTQPDRIAFSADNYEAVGQRIWSVRVDGSDLRAVRPQEHGEWISHEFWMPDGLTLGYKYQDRRRDPELMDLPWAEYARVPTRFGLASVDGPELFLSDPLNHYHSHIMAGADGQRLLGEGTDGHFFIYAARLDRGATRLEFTPQATLHTPYIPTAGMYVNGYFTIDHRWILYNDTVDGRLQIFAVEVDGI